MKLFKWIIEIRIKDLSAEEKCVYLVNKLVKEYEKTGRTLRSQEEFFALHIYSHRIDSEDAIFSIETFKSREEGAIKGKLTAKIK